MNRRRRVDSHESCSVPVPKLKIGLEYERGKAERSNLGLGAVVREGRRSRVWLSHPGRTRGVAGQPAL